MGLILFLCGINKMMLLLLLSNSWYTNMAWVSWVQSSGCFDTFVIYLLI